MKITKKHKDNIEKIISEMECPKDFLCYESGLENLSKIRLIADNKRVECLEKSLRCRFVLDFGRLALCQCPLRNYIALNFKI